MKPKFSITALLVVITAAYVCFADTPPSLTIPATTSVGANKATVSMLSSKDGTGYFTMVPGSGSNCGTGAKVAFGPYTTGSYHGSLPLFANVSGNYTVRNLKQDTAYTVCFTADSPSGSNLNPSPVFANISTTSAKAFTSPGWSTVGSAGFTGGSAGSTSLAFAPDGTPFVAYSDYSGANNGKATVMKYSDGDWSVVGRAGFSEGVISSASLAFAPDGTPYIAYQDGGNGYKATVMKYSGGDWNGVGSASTDMVDYTSLAFAPDGTPYLAYSDYADFGKTTVRQFSGVSWGLVGESGFSSGDAYYLSLAFAPDGTPYLAYLDGGNGYKATVMSFNGSSWSVFGNAGFSDGYAAYTSLAIAQDGKPYVAYVDYYASYKTTVMKYNGSTWIPVGGNAGFSAGAADYTALAIAPDGTPYVAYSDYSGANNGKATVMKYNDNTWSVVGSSGFSAGTANTVSLAFAPDGTSYAAYGDDGNASKATVMKLVNLVPTISGPPATTATLNVPYIFTPAATNVQRFSVTSKFPFPSWLGFNETTGTLSGTPDMTGTIEDIVITATNAVGSAELPKFSINVIDVPDTNIIAPLPISTSAAFELYFSSTAPGSTFECSLNGGIDYFACTTPYSGSIASCSTCRPDTSMNFSVRARTGSPDLSPATYVWTINQTIGNLIANVLDGGEIQLMAADYTENLNFSRGVSIKLKGGYGSGYSTNSGLTSIHGTFTISGSTVTCENIVIK